MALRAPVPALDAFASGTDPSLRGPALAALVRSLPDDDVARYAVQGSYDPDPAIQAEVVEALAARPSSPVVDPLVDAYLTRASADPYSRALLALERRAAGQDVPDFAEAWRAAKGWRRTPLALVAWRQGDEAARTALLGAVRQADLRDTPAFLVALVAEPDPDVVAALVAGEAWAEDGMLRRLRWARALAGDAAGRTAWRAALKDDDTLVRRDAADLVMATPPALRGPLVDDLRLAPDGSLRTLGALLATPTPGKVARAARSSDPWLRSAVFRLVDELGPLVDPVLPNGLVDDDLGVRIDAAAATVARDRKDLDEVLRTLAVHDAPQVRVAAHAARLALGLGG